MSVVTNVPIPTLGPTGYVAPPESAILSGVNADLNLAFGGNLNPSPSTPQGQIAASTTAIIGDMNALFLQYTNLVDPAQSSGRMQDAIGAIYFITRNPAQPTTVQATCSGLAKVVIPVGATAQASDGNLYFCTQAGTIPSGGSVVLPFACAVTGPIACPEGSLSTIYTTTIFGWDSITNDVAGVLGNVVESPAAFELRRQQSVAMNAIGSLPSVTAAVLSVSGVLDCYTTENVTDSTMTIGGFSLSPHSLYVCTAGGAAASIAQAIWSKKSQGCNYNGNTSVTVYDTTYVEPQPSYAVLFETATPKPTLFAVTIKNSVSVPSNALALIQEAIMLSFAGADGGTRARIGSQIFASRYYSSVALLGSWAQIITLFIGSVTAASASAVATGCTIFETTLTVTAVSSGTLGAGQSLFDTTGAIVPGTMIVSQLSGPTGGAGTYMVNVSQTIASSETITSAIANLNDVTMLINEVPVVSSANIILNMV